MLPPNNTVHSAHHDTVGEPAYWQDYLQGPGPPARPPAGLVTVQVKLARQTRAWATGHGPRGLWEIELEA